MFNGIGKTDAEWRQDLQQVKDDCDVKLMDQQRVIDKLKYDNKNLSSEETRLNYLLEYVLDYFVNVRRIEIPPEHLDVYYMEEVVEKYYKNREEKGDD